MLRELRVTSDGSSTVYVPQWDEHYHSIHGAHQESMCVFIDNGLRFFANKPHLRILEIGMGTGLNAFLTIKHKNPEATVFYEGLEAYPIEAELWRQLNYVAVSAIEDRAVFEAIHESHWGKPTFINPKFELLKHQAKLEDWVPVQGKIDLIYFDAFAPSAQPELWTTTVFEKMYAALDTGGILVTYCAKGSVKRILKAIGFEVQALPGPPRKREMTRAIKK